LLLLLEAAEVVLLLLVVVALSGERVSRASDFVRPIWMLLRGWFGLQLIMYMSLFMLADLSKVLAVLLGPEISLSEIERSKWLCGVLLARLLWSTLKSVSLCVLGMSVEDAPDVMVPIVRLGDSSYEGRWLEGVLVTGWSVLAPSTGALLALGLEGGSNDVEGLTAKAVGVVSAGIGWMGNSSAGGGFTGVGSTGVVTMGVCPIGVGLGGGSLSAVGSIVIAS
jgi:hypothetical protein